ncbi:SDR family NAD(P)-dependent oxidoreductase [Plantactinospora endophytica]|uniref:Oxidoreductase n=1 Tax=Plantactinospora endophytica TaxID=673535 RepID=A0ABQ4DSI6_9ACTN|nr:SDR family NAD(P)-dependent oxidoreductase [Plantactinospora endophytica]GIG85409.1 oxidoreductase [Plantactinospora endophytica]
MSDSRITTPFGAQSTAAEVIAGVDLLDQRAIVTGAASGIGVETARALARAGADVTLGVRDIMAGERVAREVAASTGNDRVRAAVLDLADLGSVRAFVADWTGPLHILVNNAGVMAPPLTRTAPGWELQFATNHLGHFALTTGLHDALAAAGRSRVASVSSRGHLRGQVDFDDPNFERREYDPWVGYGQSKTANILFAVEADKRWAADGITVNSLHPGAILESNLKRHMSQQEIDAAVASGQTFKTPEQGAATTVLVATWPGLDGVGGRYFEDCNEARPHAAGVTGVAEYALDPEAAARLWQLSTELIAKAG